jgi:hypothetical protein
MSSDSDQWRYYQYDRIVRNSKEMQRLKVVTPTNMKRFSVSPLFFYCCHFPLPVHQHSEPLLKSSKGGNFQYLSLAKNFSIKN